MKPRMASESTAPRPVPGFDSGRHTQYATLIRRVRLRYKFTFDAGTLINFHTLSSALGGNVAVENTICVPTPINLPNRCNRGRCTEA
jgi:hypothetical protein